MKESATEKEKARLKALEKRLHAEMNQRDAVLRQEILSPHATLVNGLSALRSELDALRGEVNQRDAVLRQEILAPHAKLSNGLSALRSELDALRSEVNHRDTLIRQEITSLHATLANGLSALRSELDVHVQQHSATRSLLRSVARSAEGLAQALWRQQTVPAPARLPGRDFERAAATLEQTFPRAFSLWKGLCEANESAYLNAPTDHCSLEGHEAAEWFGYFILPYLRGRVLDVGCGPQQVPAYLGFYPTEMICGLDPLPPCQSHPFDFVRGFAELMPWADHSFDVVCAATSLDHVLSPDVAFAEIARVLKPSGVALVWQAHVPSAGKYDPYCPELKPVDPYHLFHFSESAFDDLVNQRFAISEKIRFDSLSHFYCLRLRN
jgi:SAM-dependent methyltransferase